MNKEQFILELRKSVLILDGATGTQMQKRGMPNGICPEKWAVLNPDAIIDIQKKYVEAGANIIYSCTFGANRAKLSEFGLESEVYSLNKKLALLSKEACGNRAYVAGDISSIGQFIKPFGPVEFEDAVDIFKEQVKGLIDGKVDLFVIETMSDIQEARAALLAVKELTDLPVLVTMTYNEDGRTLTGTDPLTALITLQSLGADAVGCNCSSGPKEMKKFIEMMKPYSKVPLIAKPNAGLPKLVDGKTIFTMEDEEFGVLASDLSNSGANMIGGCCGTAPSYIEKLSQRLKKVKPIHWYNKEQSAVTSVGKTVFINEKSPFIVVGERINPTGKKKMQEELSKGIYSEVKKMAVEQVDLGSQILDVNVGMPGIDEAKTMMDVVNAIVPIVNNTPLCIDSSKPEAIERALRIYPGRALINSISGESSKIKTLMKIASKYGAMFVLLPIDDNGIPENVDQKIRIIENVYNCAKEFGILKSSFVVDGLVMTVSSNQNAAIDTLKLIRWVSEELGTNTIIGLSNISFGLPERGLINSTFLNLAIGNGLKMAIANPNNKLAMDMISASNILMGIDINGNEFIKKNSIQIEKKEDSFKSESLSIEKRVYNAIIKGYKEDIFNLVNEAMSNGIAAKILADEYMIPAIKEVGNLYEKKVYYLPQLIQSAETLKSGFEILEIYLKNESSKEVKPKIVIATVKGDIHDIGKNIVSLILNNYGFEVIDLGKDVDSYSIVKGAVDNGAKLIGLSALMTTTMMEMKEVVKIIKEKSLDIKVMIGGAVVTQAFADEIGADGYSVDANKAVEVAKRLLEV